MSLYFKLDKKLNRQTSSWLQYNTGKGTSHPHHGCCAGQVPPGRGSLFVFYGIDSQPRALSIRNCAEFNTTYPKLL